MKYLHEEEQGDIIYRWANDVSDLDKDNPEYYKPKYVIRKIGTLETYSSAYDLKNSERIRLGLNPYYYEATDEIVKEDVEDDRGEIIEE